MEVFIQSSLQQHKLATVITPFIFFLFSAKCIFLPHTTVYVV